MENHTDISPEEDHLNADKNYFSLSVRASLLVLYGTAIAICIGGNCLVCYVVHRDRRLHKPTNYLVVALACSDVSVMVLCVPFTVVSNLIYNYWVFGETLCSLVGYIQIASVIQRSLLLVAIAADRHHAVWRPLRKAVTKTTIKVTILAIWVVSLTIPLPTAMYSKIVGFDHGMCLEVWPVSEARHIYGVSLMLLTYFLPLAVLLITYTHMVWLLWGRNSPGEPTLTSTKRRTELRKRFIKMMVVVMAVYAGCWLPLHTITIAGDVDQSIYNKYFVNVLWLLSHWLAMCNSATNPFIYFTMNSSFKDSLKVVSLLWRGGDRHAWQRRALQKQVTASSPFSDCRRNELTALSSSKRH